jgi:succinate dehydrogenase/fumarate reductase flavoprotein subunit
MTEALEGQVKAKKIKIFSSMQIVKILTTKNETAGLLCLNLKALEKSDDRFVIFLSPSIVWATGGPADIYGSSVYPAGQHGAQGAAFEAGAAGRNLTEWQYGLASVKPRWNVSGTYMQALPRFVSVDPADKNDKGQEFLLDYFASPGEMLSTVFLKGYQWPFDTRKLTGSSLIDVLVYNELRQGRKVYLDFRQNPLGNNAIDYAALSPEAGNYLKAAGACFGNPFQRLEKMNRPAIDFYLDKGVDLKKDLLEISLSAQHNNGGLAVNLWWQSNLKGLFPAGEAAGTHGVYRPGGSALNSGQAGSFRAALYIARQGKHENKNPEILKPYLEKQILEVITLADKIIETKCDTVTKLTREVQNRMSLSGGPFRNEKAIKDGLKEAKALLKQFPALAGVSSAKNLHRAFRLRDILISQVVYLSAMEDYIAQGGGSRGSALYYHNDGEKPQKNLPDVFRTKSPDNSHDSLIQEVSFKNSRVKITYRERNPIPADDDFFENVWRTYRENGNVI